MKVNLYLAVLLLCLLVAVKDIEARRSLSRRRQSSNRRPSSKTLTTVAMSATLLRLATEQNKRTGYKPPSLSSGYFLTPGIYLDDDFNVNGNQYWTPHFLLSCSDEEECLRNCLIVPTYVSSKTKCRYQFFDRVNNQTTFKFVNEFVNSSSVVHTTRDINICCSSKTTRATISFYVLMLSLLISMLR
uniref:Uncharacterized LOC100176193 n=1 Tax=Ciona intestinalis TaxID=7719 RepID=A0A1W2WB43_CIOIN|nr:uncharacterized protein LOC100176193 [Ciona intestinalis]XP_026690116.1 uncharacterized protein LOC100176193 [Ciona intestinalis]|eukprot:XP_026690115.1 uncharacterized protein LOC100176193 [Ciona intestinalis]